MCDDSACRPAQRARGRRSSPWQNGYCESFNGRFRDEFLITEQFDTLLRVLPLAFGFILVRGRGPPRTPPSANTTVSETKGQIVIMRRAVRQVLVGVSAMAALLVSAGAAQAAPQPEAGPIGMMSAELGHICDGTFGNIPKFVIISDGGIPKGSTWTVSTSNVDWADFVASPDSALIQTTRIDQYAVSLKALVAIPSGTVVKVTPSYFYIDSSGTTVQISGYGGSDSMHFTLQSGPC